MLHEGKVRLLEIMYEEADLLNNIGNIRPSKGEILESTCKTVIMNGVLNRRTI
jgi:hypothetical protein